jgi:putative ABC transport system substrate-binding protein
MRRRELIGFLGATAVSLPLGARAQQTMRRVAVVLARRENDPLGRSYLSALQQGLRELGWHEGRNLQVEVRWAGGDADLMREIATEFMKLKPDVIVASGSPTVAALKHSGSLIPVVFVGINEPVVQGFIASMAHPGGNITGFTQVDFFVVGKSVEMLKAIAPELARVGLMYNPETYSFYDTYLSRFQAEARWPMALTRAAVRAPADIDVAVAELASRPNGGMVVMSDTFNSIHQATIRTSLERYRLPHIVPWREYVTGGGMMSYGPSINDIFRRSAQYVDRILKGATPSELPAQAPTKYELVINLKTTKALGLRVPDQLMALADEVVE